MATLVPWKYRLFFSFDQLTDAINERFNDRGKHLDRIYLEKNGDIIPVTDVKDLIDQETYYVLHRSNEFPTKKAVKFSQMEEFFQKLESNLSNPSKRQDQMNEVRRVFDYNDIELDTLMNLTDKKLDRIGIKLGLREKIMAVINNNL